MAVSSRSLACAIALSMVAVSALQPARAADVQKFASETIDLGIVVSDVAKSVKFYTDALGFSETQGFSVGADFCADAGLTDRQALKIRVLVLGTSPSATKIKLMEVPGVKMKQTDNGFIHSQLGYRYLTIHVADATAALARLQKAGAKPIAKGPVALPAGLPAGMTLTVVRDPDGNLIELVGPKK